MPNREEHVTRYYDLRPCQTSVWETWCGIRLWVRIGSDGMGTPDLEWLDADHPAGAACKACAAAFIASIPTLESLTLPPSK